MGESTPNGLVEDSIKAPNRVKRKAIEGEVH